MESSVLEQQTGASAQGRVFCVVPMHKNHWSKCTDHADLFSRFLRRVGLDGYRFNMQQRHPLMRYHQGKTTLAVSLEKGRHSQYCVLTISEAGQHCWPYVIDHAEYSAEEVYQMLRTSMEDKEKIHFQ